MNSPPQLQLQGASRVTGGFAHGQISWAEPCDTYPLTVSNLNLNCMFFFDHKQGELEHHHIKCFYPWTNKQLMFTQKSAHIIDSNKSCAKSKNELMGNT